MRLEEIASVCKPRGIPIMVDAASEHIERPSPWLRRGADLVVYSGGKFLRGPQTSGLLLGNKRLVQAAWRNGSPHQALGRPMKVSKEDIIGVLAALEYWFGERDDAAERQKWDDDLRDRSPSGSAQIDGVARRGHRAERRRPGAAAQDRLGPRALPARRARAARSACSTASRGSCSTTIQRDRQFDRDRPVPAAARRGGAGRRRDRRGAARVADQPAASDARAGARRSPASGNCASTFMHGTRTHRLALEQQRRRPRRAAALGAVRGAGQRRARRRPYPLRLRRRATRRARSPTASRAAIARRRDGRHGRCSAPPATRTRASSTAPSSAPGPGGRAGLDRSSTWNW